MLVVLFFVKIKQAKLDHVNPIDLFNKRQTNQ